MEMCAMINQLLPLCDLEVVAPYVQSDLDDLRLVDWIGAHVWMRDTLYHACVLVDRVTEGEGTKDTPASRAIASHTMRVFMQQFQG